MTNLFPEKPHRGRQFRALRRAKNLSLQALGAAIGVDPSTISRWESRREFHQFSRFILALHKLGVTPEAFLELAGPAPAAKSPEQEPELVHSGYTDRLAKWGV